MMMTKLQKLAHACKSFGKDESGNSTIDFMMVLPAAMFFAATSYESGTFGLRNVMLERAMDVTVRQVRMGAVPDPTHDDLKQMICDAASIIPNCMANVKLEMIRKDPRAWTPIDHGKDCVDRESTAEPVINWTDGGNNDLMFLRACAILDPVLPTSTLGVAMAENSDGSHALVATSSFVVEPYE